MNVEAQYRESERYDNRPRPPSDLHTYVYQEHHLIHYIGTSVKFVRGESKGTCTVRQQLSMADHLGELIYQTCLRGRLESTLRESTRLQPQWSSSGLKSWHRCLSVRECGSVLSSSVQYQQCDNGKKELRYHLRSERTRGEVFGGLHPLSEPLVRFAIGHVECVDHLRELRVAADMLLTIEDGTRVLVTEPVRRTDVGDCQPDERPCIEPED